MLNFLKGMFGKKDEGIKYYEPPPGTDIRDRNVAALVLAANQAGCTGIRLRGVELSDRGVGALNKVTVLRGLDLSHAKVNDQALSVLRGPNLAELHLANTPVKGSFILKVGSLPQLAVLDLSNSQAEDKTILALRGCKLLRELDLSNTKITNNSLGYIDGLAPSLRVIKLNGIENLDGARLSLLTHGRELKVLGQ